MGTPDGIKGGSSRTSATGKGIRDHHFFWGETTEAAIEGKGCGKRAGRVCAEEEDKGMSGGEQGGKGI